MEKEVTYPHTNSYSTLYSLSPKTKKVWLVLHGIGYLSRYFIRLFKELNEETNYIIAPQAPAKYYKDQNYQRIGASWLTKENTEIEIENNLNYIEAIILKEKIPKHVDLIVIGYSQGVSIAGRWLARNKIAPKYFYIISGAFPHELKQKHFDHLQNTTKLYHIVGKNDPYFKKENVLLEKKRVATIFPDIKFITHEGGHELQLKSITEQIS